MTPPKSKSSRDWWSRIEERLWNAPEDAKRDFKDFIRRWLQIMHRSIDGFFSSHGLVYASALTYTTLLTFVPAFAILLAILKGFSVEQYAPLVIKQIPIFAEAYADRARYLAHDGATSGAAATLPTRATPAAASETTSTTTSAAVGEDAGLSTLADLADNIIAQIGSTNFPNLGILGFTALLLLVISLLSQIEKAMNEAWSVHRSRSFARKLSDYMNLLVVVTVLILAFAALITNKLSAWFQSKTWVQSMIQGADGRGAIDYAGAHLLRLIPFLLLLAAFVFVYFYIPNTRVRWRSAAAGGLAAWFVFIVVQFIFIRALPGLFSSRIRVYGAFAAALLVLFFVYLFWCVVLWGVEVCSAHQNLRDWRRRRRAWRGLPAERETLALRLAALLARPLLGRPEPAALDVGALADRLNVPPIPVAEMLELFRGQGLLVQSAEDGGYMLARSPEDLGVLDLLRLVRQGDLAAATDEKGAAATRLAPQALPPAMARTIKDLADEPLESIQTFAI